MAALFFVCFVSWGRIETLYIIKTFIVLIVAIDDTAAIVNVVSLMLLLSTSML